MDNNQYNNQSNHSNSNTQYNSNPQYNPNSQHNSNNNNSYGYGSLPTPYYNPYPRRDPNNEPMELKDWIITFLLLLIPFANIVLPFVWAFGTNVNKSKKTFFQAYLIITLISFVFTIIFIILLITVFAAAFESIPDYYSLSLTYISVFK